MNLQVGESLEHRELFDYYYLLPAQERSYAKVAEKFAGREINKLPVTESRVKRWAGQFHWPDMVKERDAKISEKVDEQIIEKVADKKAELLAKTSDLINRWFAQKLGEVEKAAQTIDRIPAKDILGFMKFQNELVETSPDPTDAKKENDGIPALRELTPDELRRLAKGDKPSRTN